MDIFLYLGSLVTDANSFWWDLTGPAPLTAHMRHFLYVDLPVANIRKLANRMQHEV